MWTATIVYDDLIVVSYPLFLCKMYVMGSAILGKLKILTILSDSGDLEWLLQVYLHNLPSVKYCVLDFIGAHYCAIIWIDLYIEVIIVQIPPRSFGRDRTSQSISQAIILPMDRTTQDD